MSDGQKPFWETLPGILTGVAAVLTALGGLLTVVYTRGQQAAASEKEVSARAPLAVPDRKVAALMERPVRDRVNLAGAWRDAETGHQVRIAQNGSRITSATVDLASRQVLARGQGILKGRAVEGSNHWADGSVYAVTLKVSEDGQEISGYARNPHTGESTAVLLLRQN